MTAHPLETVGLRPLMGLTAGRPEIAVGIIDGPVFLEHACLAGQAIRELRARSVDAGRVASTAYLHGTFVTGILAAPRGSPAPAICPECTFFVRAIFPESAPGEHPGLYTNPQELADAVVDTVDAGARVINMSVALAEPSSSRHRNLEWALDHAAQRSVIVVVAAGNQGTLGSSTLTRHPWVIPVAAVDSEGRPISFTNLSASIGRNGLSAPGDGVTSLTTVNEPLTLGGTSVAAPFVTGAAALLWSTFPGLSGFQIKTALREAASPRRASVVPPLLDAWTAYLTLAAKGDMGKLRKVRPQEEMRGW